MHIIMQIKWSESNFKNLLYENVWVKYLIFVFSLVLIKDHCLNFIVKDENFNEIVMSNDFVTLDKPLMVELIRKRVYPGRVNDLVRTSRLTGTTLENDMAAFLRNGSEFCDINLVLEDKIIPAHKSILAARCSYFQAMFRSFMPPDNTVNVCMHSINEIVFFIKILCNITDSNWRHNAITRGIFVIITVHLLRWNSNATRRFTLFISSFLLLRWVWHLLIILIFVERRILFY